ncbi:hypothetical protein ES705_49471 [subsurface metagenome]
MLGTGGVGRDEWQVDVSLNSAGKLHLGLLGTFLEMLQCHGIITKFYALVFLELIGHPVDEYLVDIVAAKVRITVGGLNLEDTPTQLQDGNVKGSAAKIKDGDSLVLLFVQAIRQGGGGGLVDDAPDVQPRNLAGIFRGLAL